MFVVFFTSMLNITNVQAETFTLDVRDFPRSEREGYDKGYSTIDTSLPIFKARFLKSTESGCAYSYDYIDDNGTFNPNSKNFPSIPVSKMSANMINSNGIKTALSIKNQGFRDPFNRRNASCNLEYVRELSIESSPLKNIAEGLYTFELCLEGVCTQVPNIRVKKTPSFDVAYYPSSIPLKEYDFSVPTTKVNIALPNIRLSDIPGLANVMFKRYIGLNGKYSEMYGFNAVPSTTVGGSSPATNYPSYWELQSNTQGSGSIDSYFPNITDELKGYKDGTYEILTCLNRSQADSISAGSYTMKLPKTTDIFCGSVDVKIKNSKGVKVPGGAKVDYDVVTNAPAETSYVFTRNLTVGSTGDDVGRLQTFLMTKGFLRITGSTGYFGALTKNALIAYQLDRKITPANGLFDSNTRSKVSIEYNSTVVGDTSIKKHNLTVIVRNSISEKETVQGVEAPFVQVPGTNMKKATVQIPDKAYISLAISKDNRPYYVSNESNCLIIGDNLCTITVRKDETIDISYGTPFVVGNPNTSASKYKITVIKSDGATGVVIGAGDYNKNYTATLKAVPTMGANFVGWSGGKCNGITTPICSITVTENSTEKAVFDSSKYLVTVTKNEGGIGYVLGGGYYNKNSTATVEPIFIPGSKFLNWSGGKCNGVTTPVCSFTVTGSSTEKAMFSTVPDTTVTPTPAISKYNITVTKSDGATGVIMGAGDYDKNSVVTLKAIPTMGAKFLNWSGGKCNGITTPTCLITVTENSTEKAVFDSSKYLVTVTKSDGSNGYVLGGGYYNKDSVVSIEAIANSEAKFLNWSGGKCNGITTPTCSFTVTGSSTEKAMFTSSL